MQSTTEVEELRSAALSNPQSDSGSLHNLVTCVGGKVLTEGLTTFWCTRWQKRRELKANKFFDIPGRGFVVAEAGPSKSRAQFLDSSTRPHCLMVAPMGAGKGISLVIPNLLLFNGSAVIPDVRGENYELTSRHRQSQGDMIWRFAPLD